MKKEVDAVKVPKKKKVNWKRLGITVTLVLFTAGATAGTLWYYMNEVIRVKDAHIDSLDTRAEVSLIQKDDEDEGEDDGAEECEEFEAVVGFKPGGLFTEAEKSEIKTKITEPYIYYINNVEAQPDRSVVSVVVEEYSAKEIAADSFTDYHYGVDVVVENGYSGGWLFGDNGNVDYWVPECMDECQLTQDFVDNYPNNLPDSYSIK